MRFTPFENGFDNVTAADLANLTDVAEGWYVEYKSEPPSTRDLAKSLSSFANQYGGWLFIGVEEEPELKTAARLPGIADSQVPSVLESLRNAAKDIVRPQVAFVSRTFDGPIEELGLTSGRSVLVVHVPEGANTPHIHNNGRIYIRVGDSSTPVPALDKSTFDLLYQRGETKRAYLEGLIGRSPELSQAEENNIYIHLSILSDPYETLEHWYGRSFTDFSNTMTVPNIPFDNIYSSSNGFVARQVKGNDRYHRTLTWEFSRNCHSFVTMPLPILPLNQYESFDGSVDEAWEPYSIGPEFELRLREIGLTYSRILNLNILLPLLRVIFARHRTLAGGANVKGPFYVKALIENVWRVVPFLDIDDYKAHVEKFDFPVVQESELMVPPGTSLETFAVSPELDHVPSETDSYTDKGAVAIWLHILEALGIPGQLLAKNSRELIGAGNRESEMRRSRVSSF